MKATACTATRRTRQNRRMRSLYPVCLFLALAPPVARAELPIGSNGSSSNGAAVSRQFAKMPSAKREGSPSSKNPPPRKNPLRRSPVPSTENDVNDEGESETSRPTTPPQSHSSSVSIGVGGGAGGLSLIQGVLSGSAPVFRCVAFGAQLAVASYLARASWTVVRDVWEEVNEEFAAARAGKAGGGGDVREEQDMPYADEDAFSGGLGEGGGAESDASDVDEDDVDRPGRRRRGQKQSGGSLTPQMTATRELAARLHSAGIPYASELPAENHDGSAHRSDLTVEGIMRSLTRADGNMLAQTLLSPLDGGLLDGGRNTESSAAAAASWNAIGGLSDAKESLLDLAFPLLPTRSDSEEDDHYGGLLANPPGVLLYGPPGCGKTALVRALAATAGARFLAVSPSCLLRKYVGETNLNVRALFSVARKIAPCVVFVDELDGLFRERGGEDHDAGRDLKTEFLQLWDGIRDRARAGGGSVLVIGATNRPFDVDPAFLRRMPRRVFVGLPDHDSRVSVLRSMLDRVPLDPNFDLGFVASRTGGYSPSDIREVLQAAALYPLREARAESISSSRMNGGNGGRMPPLRKLQTDDVLRALEVAKPTHFSRKYQRELMDYVRKTGGSRAPSEGDAGENNFIADAGTFNGDCFDRHDADESDAYSYDEDLSDSDYDDL